MSAIFFAAVGSILLTLVTLTAITIRYGLVPFMRTQLIDPILVQLASVLQLANEAVNQVHVIAAAWDGHLEWSQREVDRLWEQMLIHERILNRQRLQELGDVPRQSGKSERGDNGQTRSS
ncbi:MAG: hypothetical protein JWQ32_2075 [Marmoricola sp.]|nr:hypothetical protein [Marmoricola sp.]